MNDRPVPLVIAPGRHAERTARLLAARLPAEALVNPPDVTAAMRAAFAAGRPVIGLCAAAILVRALGGQLRDKTKEPPVVAVSADGAHVVPLLGGHSGANELARAIAWITGGLAAVTTATDNRFAIALDDPPRGWRLAGRAHVKPFARALLAGARVRLAGHAPWLERSLPLAADGELAITVSEKAIEGNETHLVYHPATVCVGVGLARGAAAGEVSKLVRSCLAGAGLSPLSVAAIGTMVIKADEPALAALSKELNAPLRLFSAEELAAMEVPNPSEVVRRETGTPSVAEAAALRLAGEGARLVTPKRKSPSATCAIALSARPLADPPGRPRGHLSVVGLGPGAPRMRTPQATHALLRATDWVGYGLYLELAADLSSGKRLHPFPLGGEEERVRHAISLAAEGRKVALLCSGDAAIYAMASLVFEVREQPGLGQWEQRISVEVIPGISALQAASARAGALIGHDFCAISLSDLLTPWQAIEKRLVAAARGDFVTALYNPRSRRRTSQLTRALEIFRQHRPPSTPAVIAGNLGRPGEKVHVTTLEKLDPGQVDMLSLVLIGNSQSRLNITSGAPVAFTPRGYGLGATEGEPS